MNNTLIEESLELLSRVNKYPLAVMFSGGKDSTTALDLIGRFALEHKIEKVYVVYCETWLDPPPVRKWVYSHLEKVKEWAETNNQPFEILIITPPEGKDFFTLVLERGYALPVIRRHAPWCNKEMKTRPTAKVLRRKLKEEGYKTLVYIVGSRASESPKRRKSLEKIGVKNPLTRTKLEYLGEVCFLALIYNWTDKDVFTYLKTHKSIYGDSFKPLLELYKRYGEKGTKLRTGCWVCPRIPRDYFMEAYTKEHPEYKIITETRRKLIEISENPKYRTAIANGKPAGRLTEEGKRKIAKILCELLNTNAGKEFMKDYLDNVPKLKKLLAKYGCNLDFT